MRISELFSGYVRLTVLRDPSRRVLSGLVERSVSVWDVHAHDGSDAYSFSVGLRHVRMVIHMAKRIHGLVRFGRKSGLPFWIWRARRRKAFVAGFACFVVALFALSSFVWNVEIEGTDEPQLVASALQKLHVTRGTLIYQLADQDAMQLALLDMLPHIAWVGVRVQGTSVFVKVIPRVPTAQPPDTRPQSIIARVPGVVESVLADYGQPAVKAGQYVLPGTVLISGVLDDGKTIHAQGKVDAVVWYRTDVIVPQATATLALTGASVRHYYLQFGNFPLQVWGFSHPPFAKTFVQDAEQPISVFDFVLPLRWRVETVYQALRMPHVANQTLMTEQGRAAAARTVMQQAAEGAKVIRQNVLQEKLEHGKLYMSVWTEVLEDIGKPQPLLPHNS